MNLLFVVLVLCTTFVQNHSSSFADFNVDDQKLYQDTYKKWFEKVSEIRQVSDGDAAVFKALEILRQLIITGDPKFLLDPLQIPSIGPITYSATSYSVEISLQEVKLEGLKNFKIEDVIVDAQRHVVNIKVSLPWISLSARYITKAPALLIQEPATGSIDVFLTNVEVDLSISHGPTHSGHLDWNSLDINIVPGTTSVKLSHYGGSRILNDMINIYLQAAAASNLQHEMPEIRKVVAQLAAPYITAFLSNYDFGGVPLRSHRYS